MKNIKRVLTILLSVCIVVIIQGCNDNKNADGGIKKPTLSNAAKESSNNGKGSDNKAKSNFELNGDEFHLKGYMVTINDDTVTISKTFIDSKGNMCDVEPGSNEAPKAEKVKITDKTEIKIKETKDCEHFTESKGSISDIDKNCLLDVQGKKEGNNLVAKKIVIYKTNQ